MFGKKQGRVSAERNRRLIATVPYPIFYKNSEKLHNLLSVRCEILVTFLFLLCGPRIGVRGDSCVIPRCDAVSGNTSGLGKSFVHRLSDIERAMPTPAWLCY